MQWVAWKNGLVHKFALNPTCSERAPIKAGLSIGFQEHSEVQGMDPFERSTQKNWDSLDPTP
eukprot:1157488-Pelagomonas_calceolata.AAC.4